MNNDLISRSALLEQYEWIKENTGTYNHAELDEHIRRIKNAPAVGAEPVQHGMWLKLAYDPAWSKCSECGCNWEWGMVENCNMIYCPNCGAKMDAEGKG